MPVRAAVPLLPSLPSEGSIPRILHQVWVGSPPPNWVLKNWALWEEMLPEWEIKHWTDDNSDEWPLSRLAWKQGLPHVVVLADLIRIEQVWKHGGVYVDSDTIPLQPIDEVLDHGPGVGFVAQGGWEREAKTTKPVELNNSTFGFPPKHPFLSEVWAQAAGSLDKKSALHIAGPLRFEKVYPHFKDDVRLPPWEQFPDLPRKQAAKGEVPDQDALRVQFPDAYLVHTADKSWFGANHSTHQTPTFIMAVPWVEARRDRAEELAAATQGEIVWDKSRHAFKTWRDVLTRAGTRAAVIIEDDVVLADNWRNRVEDVISEHPDQIIQFFSMRGADLTVGSREERGSSFMMNQCYYLPPGVARSLLDFTDDWDHPGQANPTGYDVAMAEWMKVHKHRYWLHVPSLVQHEPWTSEINSRRPRNRQSATYEINDGLPSIHVLTVPGLDPDRDAQVKSLIEAAGACVHVDPERRGVLTNFTEALECGQGKSEWTLILEDDAAPFLDWQYHLKQVMQHTPEPSVSLTHFGSYGQRLIDKGKSFGTGKNAIWGVASMYREDLVPGLLDALHYGMKVKFWGTDSVVSAYNHRFGTKSAMTARALFDHRPFKSTVGHSGRDKMFPGCTIETHPHKDGWDLGVAAVGTSLAPDSRELARMWAAGEPGPLVKGGAWRK